MGLANPTTQERVPVAAGAKLKFNDAGWGILRQPGAAPAWIKHILKEKVAATDDAGLTFIADKDGTRWLLDVGKLCEARYFTLRCSDDAEVAIKAYRFEWPRDKQHVFIQVRELQERAGTNDCKGVSCCWARPRVIKAWVFLVCLTACCASVLAHCTILVCTLLVVEAWLVRYRMLCAIAC